jgi:proline iminopeptidase
LYIYNITPKKTLPTTQAKIPYNVEVTNFGFGDFLRKFDFEPFLDQVTSETLLIVGENDWINDPSGVQLMAQKIPKNTLTILEKCGHFIWLDQREKFFAAIQKFLKKPVLMCHTKMMKYPRGY